MSKKISRVGILRGGGIPAALHSEIAVAVGAQASFAGYNKLAARTATQGEANLFGGTNATARAVGVFTDCSPKGGTGTIETEGFVWVDAVMTDLAVGGFCTPVTGSDKGKVKLATVSGFPVAAEVAAGIWQIDELDTVNSRVLIKINDRI